MFIRRLLGASWLVVAVIVESPTMLHHPCGFVRCFYFLWCLVVDTMLLFLAIHSLH